MCLAPRRRCAGVHECLYSISSIGKHCPQRVSVTCFFQFSVLFVVNARAARHSASTRAIQPAQVNERYKPSTVAHAAAPVQCCHTQRTEAVMPCSVTHLGVSYPLLLRWTPCGWGVFCDVDIPIGAFVCSYIGRLCVPVEADALLGQDKYLFELDHFAQTMNTIRQDNSATGQLHPVRRCCHFCYESKNVLVLSRTGRSDVGTCIALGVVASSFEAEQRHASRCPQTTPCLCTASAFVNGCHPLTCSSTLAAKSKCVQNEWPVLPALPPTDFYDWMASTTDLSDVAAANTPAPLEQLTGHAGSSSNATEDVAADVASTSAPARAALEWQPNVGGQLGVGIDPLIDACRAAHGGEARWSHYRRAAHTSRNEVCQPLC